MLKSGPSEGRAWVESEPRLDSTQIIPTAAFFEPTGQTPKTNHTITMADGTPLFVAGLWAGHTWEGERTESYAIVVQETLPADEMRIFKIARLCFLDGAGAARWLDLGATMLDCR